MFYFTFLLKLKLAKKTIDSAELKRTRYGLGLC